MKKLKTVFIFMLICGLLSGCTPKTPDIVVGATNYTEQYILGHMLVLLIKDNTNLKVTYRYNLTSDDIFAGIKTDVIDLYVDYTGTIYNHLNYTYSNEPEPVYDISAKELENNYNLRMLTPLGFNNTYCLVVRAETAWQYKLATISDLARVSQDFVFGGGEGILTRNDGIPNLKKMYNMSFKEERVISGMERYTALDADDTQVSEAFSTDGTLLKHGLVMLKDNKNFFPPYEGVIVIRNEILEKYPELENILDKLSGLLSDDAMCVLNHKVDILGNTPEEVARNFLKSHHLIR